MINTLQSTELGLVRLIARIGENPVDSPEVRLQKAIQVNTVVLGGIPMQLSIAGLALIYGEYLAAGATLGFLLLSTLGLLYLAVTRRHYPFFKFTQLTIPILSPFFASLALGGLVNSALAPIWGIVAPLLALVLYTLREAIYWFLAFLTAIAISGLAQPFLRQTNNMPPNMIALIGVMNIFGISIMVFAALAFFINQRDLAMRLLNFEREKSDRLLLNILPHEIADRLKARNEVIADQFEGASVLFADVVNFTPMSAGMKPVELVNLLNEVFSAFDLLVEKYDLEKIKTIGDCYMVAAGVPRWRADHAHVLVQMALDMRDHVTRHEFQGRKLQFRIGINSGPVVAGVIGRRKFIYDLWGDAVNTASRMESHGAADCIQITQSTYELMGSDFTCEPRGTVNVKGKGEMAVWHVMGPLNTNPSALVST